MASERILIVDGDADTAQVAEFERSRRDLIRKGLGFGGAVVAASSIPLLLSVRNAFAAGNGDADILERAIGLERIAILAYGVAIDSKLLSPGFTRVAKQFRSHEQEHADALSTALMDLGGTPPAKKPTVEDIDGVVEGIGEVKSQADVANFAIELEMAAVAAYYEAHRKLVDAKLLQAGASIMANEAQHLVVLRQAVKRAPVPNAFETGKT